MSMETIRLLLRLEQLTSNNENVPKMRIQKNVEVKNNFIIK